MLAEGSGMRAARFVPVALSAIAMLSCTEPGHPVVGHWVETVAPNRHLALRADGSFINYGGTFTDYWRTEGTYAVNEQRIEFHPVRLKSRSGGSPEQVIEPYPYGAVFEDCTFEFDGSALILHYTTYPADGPVLATMRLTRH